MTSVALFSPFWGANLGDSAILEAVAANLRALDRDVILSAVTMDERSMRRTHGIDGMRIYGGTVRLFSHFDENIPDGIHPVRKVAARVRILIRECGRRMAWPVRECMHLVRAYRFLRKVDLLLVAGGGQLDGEWGGPWGQPYSLFKWTLLSRLAGKRVAIMSVGICKLDSRLARWFCRSALKRSQYNSVRDPWSLAFAKEVLGVDRVVLAPDAAFSYRASARAPVQGSGGRTTIGLSPIAYGRKKVWPTVAQAVAESYQQVLTQLAARLLSSGVAVRLFATDGPDMDVVMDMVKSLREQRPAIDTSLLQVDHVNSARELLDVAAAVDLVVASRLHGVILSHLVSTPVVAISYDRKVDAHMEMIGQQDLCVPIGNLGMSTLSNLTDRALAEAQDRSRSISSATAPWRGALSDQYAAIMQTAVADEIPGHRSVP